MPIQGGRREYPGSDVVAADGHRLHGLGSVGEAFAGIMVASFQDHPSPTVHGIENDPVSGRKTSRTVAVARTVSPGRTGALKRRLWAT